ncbi:hypothetical protein LC593_04705 [Nostoc sp. CHAB 5844]|nr:hypothetical protein [Nostoc sp. CHAB 5844]
MKNLNHPPSYQQLKKRIVTDNPNYHSSMQATLKQLDRAAPQHRLTASEKLALVRNLRLILAKSLPAVRNLDPKVSARATRTLNIQLNLPRFRFLNQITQARNSLLIQLRGTGITFEGIQHEWESEQSQQWLFEAPIVNTSTFNQKYYNESDLNLYSNGCRKVTSTPCPGQKGRFTQIDYFPSMFLVNRGTCPLFIASLVNGIATNIGHLKLQPGESATFVPHQGSNGVGFGCLIGCQGNGLLEHPYLCV